MTTANECLDMLAAAYRCPDVSMLETIKLIQLDAFKDGMTEAANMDEVSSVARMLILDRRDILTSIPKRKQ
jgi:hypothetical protein